MKVKFDDKLGGNVCMGCLKGDLKDMKRAFLPPTWTDRDGMVHYELPAELLDLTEGEKLLIQQVEAYVPLVHLQYGQLGLRGHVCCFPKDISEVCKVLPKMPDQISRVKVVKHYRIGNQEKSEEDIVSKTFYIRRRKVLDALYWLKLHNPEYANISIEPENLAWMGGAAAKELPIGRETIEINEEPDGINEQTDDRDLGPARSQVIDVEDKEQAYSTEFGLFPEKFAALPKEKDQKVVDIVQQAKKQCDSSLEFPYVAADPISETEGIFVKVFPWLFPGGRGDYGDLVDRKYTMQEWACDLIHYQDSKFAEDKI